MKRTLALAMITALASSSSALASTHRQHARARHHSTSSIERLEGEIAALRRKVDQINRAPVQASTWQMASVVPFGDIVSIGEVATQAALEIPEQIIIKPLGEIAASIGLAADRAYLIATANPGYTMERQGVRLSIERLHPEFVRRLAAAFRDARRQGLEPRVFSAYRPPVYGVGGFQNKFNSAHAYGLAVDLSGIGRPGSKTTYAWRRIAATHGVYGPYSANSRSEWNHFQITPAKMVTYAAHDLRHTITARGPVSLQRMWHAADAIIPSPGKHIVLPREARAPRARHHPHYALRHRRVAYLEKAARR